MRNLVMFVIVALIVSMFNSGIKATIISPEEVKKKEEELRRYQEDIKKYKDETVLEEVVKKEIPILEKQVLIREIGKRGLEKGRVILEKYIEESNKVLAEHQKAVIEKRANPLMPPVEFGLESKASLLDLDFNLFGKSKKEYIIFLIDRMKQKDSGSDGTSILLRESLPQGAEEIANHLMANKENDRLSISLLLVLRFAETDKVQPQIIEYIRWCRETDRDKNEISYLPDQPKIKILIYGYAQSALGKIGNKQSLEIFKEDLHHSNPSVRAGAVYGISRLMNRRVTSIEDAINITELTKDDKNEDVQRAYKNLQMEIKIIQLKEEENRKNQQEDKTKPKDSSGQSDKDNTDKKPEDK